MISQQTNNNIYYAAAASILNSSILNLGHSTISNIVNVANENRSLSNKSYFNDTIKYEYDSTQKIYYGGHVHCPLVVRFKNISIVVAEQSGPYVSWTSESYFMQQLVKLSLMDLLELLVFTSCFATDNDKKKSINNLCKQIRFVISSSNNAVQSLRPVGSFELKDEHEKLKDEHEKLEGEHEKLKNGHEKLKSKHEKLKDEYEKLKSEHEKLKDLFESQMRKYNDLTKNHKT